MKGKIVEVSIKRPRVDQASARRNRAAINCEVNEADFPSSERPARTLVLAHGRALSRAETMTTPMMLDGAGAPSRWANEAVDALPYADVLPEGWREDVDRLINEEMRRMSKRPKDYLAEMAPAREIDWSRCPLLEKEFKRVAEGKGNMPPPDEARYELDPPPLNKRNDENAWEVAVKNARAQLEHQALRIQNLELAAKFGTNAWRAHNASLEAAVSTCVREPRLLRRARARSTRTLNLLLISPRGALLSPAFPVLSNHPQVRTPTERGPGGDRGGEHGT